MLAFQDEEKLLVKGITIILAIEALGHWLIGVDGVDEIAKLVS